MNTLTYIIIFSLAGGIISLTGGILLLRSRESAKMLAKYATPFAGGALLAAVFMDLLKEGVAEGNASAVLTATMIGIVVFFFAEGFLHWFHHHHDHKDVKDPKAWLVIAGDTLHNALDGVSIAASFLISIPTGIVTTIAVAAHEIPQEIGDFGLLLNKGMRRAKVLLFNLVSAMATVLAAVLTYYVGSSEQLPIGVLLGLSAGFLLYIAMSDIIPTIHNYQVKRKVFDIQAMLLLAGVLTVSLITTLAHDYIDAGHDHDEPAAIEKSIDDTDHTNTYDLDQEDDHDHEDHDH